jgi:ankyrin repeat protein
MMSGPSSPVPAVSPRRNPLLQLYSMIKDGGQEGELQQFLALRENAMWLDRKDSNGETALMVATKHDRLREMDILFDHGANPNTANPYAPPLSLFPLSLRGSSFTPLLQEMLPSFQFNPNLFCFYLQSIIQALPRASS